MSMLNRAHDVSACGFHAWMGGRVRLQGRNRRGGYHGRTGVFLMVPHRSRSNRTLPGVGVTLLLAVTLASCGRGADTPAASAPPETTAPAPAPAPPPAPRELTWSGKVDMKLWSGIRVRTYKAALKRPTPPTLAILKIPSIHLEVPVHDGTSDAVLDLAAGRIEHTALPGTPGNVGIAAHRDGYFRALKDIKEGDELVLETPVATEQYRVEWIKITVPTDVSVIDATPGPAVTLVGCYPFYHQGPAPQRFIVRAVPVTASTTTASPSTRSPSGS